MIWDANSTRRLLWQHLAFTVPFLYLAANNSLWINICCNLIDTIFNFFILFKKIIFIILNVEYMYYLSFGLHFTD